jgi:hypothetical protein
VKYLFSLLLSFCLIGCGSVTTYPQKYYQGDVVKLKGSEYPALINYFDPYVGYYEITYFDKNAHMQKLHVYEYGIEGKVDND